MALRGSWWVGMPIPSTQWLSIWGAAENLGAQEETWYGGVTSFLGRSGEGNRGGLTQAQTKPTLAEAPGALCPLGSSFPIGKITAPPVGGSRDQSLEQLLPHASPMQPCPPSASSSLGLWRRATGAAQLRLTT